MPSCNYDRLVTCDGRLMSARMAAIKTGLAPSTVMKLHNAGKPIVKQPTRGKDPRRAMHNGQLMSALAKMRAQCAKQRS